MSAGALRSAIERMEIRTSFPAAVAGAARYYRTLLPLMPAAVRGLRIPSDVDLVVSLSHAVAKGVVPPPRRAARVLLLHADALRLAPSRGLFRWRRRRGPLLGSATQCLIRSAAGIRPPAIA